MNVKTLLPIGLGLLSFAGMAAAGNSPDPSRLPPCQSSSTAETCRLPLKNGQIDSLEGWNRSGLPSIGQDETGNAYAALHVGAFLSQPVFAHFAASPQNVAYALRFRTRADRGAGELRATLSMSDGSGDRTIPLGETTTTARAGEWNVVELMVNGTAFPAPAHVMVTIANEGGNIVQVDDVTLVQAEGVEAARR